MSSPFTLFGRVAFAHGCISAATAPSSCFYHLCIADHAFHLVLLGVLILVLLTGYCEAISWLFLCSFFTVWFVVAKPHIFWSCQSCNSVMYIRLGRLSS